MTWRAVFIWPYVVAMVPDAAVRERVGSQWRAARKAATAGADESVARWAGAAATRPISTST